LIKTLVNEACHSIIPEIKRKGSFHSINANHGKFWVYHKEDDFPVIKSTGIITLKNNVFMLNKKPAKFESFEQRDDVLLLHGVENEQDNPLKLYFCCKECLNKLILKLNKTTFWKKEKVKDNRETNEETGKGLVEGPVEVNQQQRIQNTNSLRGGVKQNTDE
jgi:hypothetical protein